MQPLNETLIQAIEDNDLDKVIWCQKQGADIHADNNNALRRAAACNHFTIVEYLVEQGADIHASNGSTLAFAVAAGCLKTVKYLVNQGANIYDWGGQIPDIAKTHNHIDVETFLSDTTQSHRLLKRLKTIDFSTFTDFAAVSTISNKHNCSPLVIMAMTGNMHNAMSLYAQKSDQSLTPQDLRQTYEADSVDLEYILKETGQLSVLFHEKYWVGRDGKTTEQLTQLYNALFSNNRKHVAYTYQTTLALMGLQQNALDKKTRNHLRLKRRRVNTLKR